MTSPTLETLAAVDLLRRHTPDLAIRVVNIVDLMTLQSKSAHPHGLADADFDALFTIDRPVIFAYHGYPSLIHRLLYKRRNHANMHVHGYQEEGSTTTSFDMVVRNELDRFHLAADVIDHVPKLAATAIYARQAIRDKLVEHKRFIAAHGFDMPEIRGLALEPADGQLMLSRLVPGERTVRHLIEVKAQTNGTCAEYDRRWSDA